MPEKSSDLNPSPESADVGAEGAAESGPLLGNGFTPDIATAVLNKARQNIVAKVAQGGTLTATERALMEKSAQSMFPATESEDEGPKWVESQIDLAKALGVERRTIQRDLKADGNPGKTPDGRYNVHEWRAWRRIRGRKCGGTQDKHSLECKKLNIDIERKEFEFAVFKAEYSKNSDITEWFGQFGYTLRQLLDALPGQLAPDVVALPIPDAESLIRNAIEEVKAKISSGEWRPAPTATEPEAG